MLKKISMFILFFIFLCSPVFSKTTTIKPPPTKSKDQIETIGKSLNKKITNFLEIESKEGRFNKKSSIEYQNLLLKKISSNYIEKEKTIIILNSRIESWGYPDNLMYITVKLFVECTDCPDNLFIMDFYYIVYEESQDPVQPDKSVKI